MSELDEAIENGTKVHVFGIGESGRRAVTKMISRFDERARIGIGAIMVDSTGNLSFQTVTSTDNCTNLTVGIGTSESIFIIANPAEDYCLLERACRAAKAQGLHAYLIIPETITHNKTTAPHSANTGGDQLVLDSLFTVSHSSMSPLYPPQTEIRADNDLMDYLVYLLIQQLYEPMITHGFVGADSADLQCVIRGSVMRLGVGVANGDEKASNAVKIALARLAEQGIDPKNIAGVWCVVSGSSNILGNEHYNAMTGLSMLL